MDYRFYVSQLEFRVDLMPIDWELRGETEGEGTMEHGEKLPHKTDFASTLAAAVKKLNIRTNLLTDQRSVYNEKLLSIG